jgi:hypothetical protein
MHQLTTLLQSLTSHTDRHIKGHSIALLKRLQELNPQDND